MLKVIYQFILISLSYLFGMILCGKEAFTTLLTLLFLLYSLVINEKSRKFIYLWVIIPVFVFVFFKISNGFDSKYIQNYRVWILVGLHFVMILVGYMVGFFISKCKAKTVNLTILIAVTVIIHVLGNLIAHSLSFMTTGIIFFIAPYIAYQYISQKKYIPLIIVIPMMLLGLQPWLARYLGTLPLTLIPFCSIGIYYLAFLLKRKRIIQIVLISTYAIFLIYGWYKGFGDYNQWLFVQKAKLTQDLHAEYTFYEIDGQTVTQDSHEGKIVVFDFWTTSCGVCFREFPEFDKAYQKYKHRDDVVFYAVNLPTKRDTRESIMETIARHVNYSFPVLLAEESSDYWTQFKISGVPHMMILDKTGKVVFNGVNYEKMMDYNIENTINNLLK